MKLVSKLLILDANVIIDAHQKGYWQAVVSKFQLHIPKTIISESSYFEDNYGQNIKIDLAADLAQGKIVEIEARPEELAMFSKDFRPTFVESIDDGEREALAILYGRPNSNLLFCTGDMRAIISLAVMDLAISGISLERVLRECGMKGKKVPPHFSEKTFQTHLGKGAVERSMHRIR